MNSDAALATVRDEVKLAELPQAQEAEWREFWQETKKRINE